jgi:hypothetical protein
MRSAFVAPVLADCPDGAGICVGVAVFMLVEQPSEKAASVTAARMPVWGFLIIVRSPMRGFS